MSVIGLKMWYHPPLFISPYSVAFGVILSLLLFCLFVRLRISQRRMVRSA